MARILFTRVLRCTQVYRRLPSRGRDWKVIHRHADEVAEIGRAAGGSGS